MPKSKLQKQSDLEKIKEQIAGAKAITFTDYRGMKMEDLDSLRKTLRSKGGKFTVTKVSLAGLAFGDKEKLQEIVGGESLALAYSNQDEVSVAKEVKKAGKKNENIKILGGFYEGRFLNREEMEALADLPNKEELLTKLLWVVKAPGNNFAGAMNNFAQRLVYVLKAVSEKQV
ncbi:50S ribosomal protein L10 [Candidatus Microgenomates bacterium]|nr:50S ribosomal protein L10 [Candidatus Microgenomates bacterium]